MVPGNAVFIRKEAKLDRNTHLYTFSMRNFTFNSVNFPEHTPLAAKAGTYVELKASHFLND